MTTIGGGGVVITETTCTATQSVGNHALSTKFGANLPAW